MSVQLNHTIVWCRTNESVKTFYEALGYSTEPRISMGKKIESNIAMPRE